MSEFGPGVGVFGLEVSFGLPEVRLTVRYVFASFCCGLVGASFGLPDCVEVSGGLMYSDPGVVSESVWYRVELTRKLAEASVGSPGLGVDVVRRCDAWCGVMVEASFVALGSVTGGVRGAFAAAA